MEILVMLIVGLVVGVVAKFVMPGDDPGGIVVTALIGIAGAMVGGFLGRALGLYAEGQAAGFFMSVAGALVLLYGYRLVRSRA